MSGIQDFFSGLEKREAESASTGAGKFQQNTDPTGTTLDICYKTNRGTSILRPITDVNGYPLREINDAYDLYEVFPMLDAEGKQRVGDDGTPWVTSKHTFVMATPNYRCQLTPDQINLQNALIKAIKDYNELVTEKEVIDPDKPEHGITTKLRVNQRWKITMFWAKVLSLTVPGQGCILSDGAVRLIRHHGSSFRQDITTAIQSKTAMKGGDGSWQEAFFNRNAGPATAVMSVNVTQQQGFKNTIQFEEMGPNYQVDAKDLEVAGDLFAQGDSTSKPWTVGLNATVYPHAEMMDTYNRITGYLNAYMQRAGAAAQAQAPQQAPVQPQPTQSAPQQFTGQPVPNPIPPTGVPTQATYSAPPPQAAQPVQPQVQPVVQPIAQPVVPQPQVVQPVQVQPIAQPVVQPIGVPIQQPVQAVPTL